MARARDDLYSYLEQASVGLTARLEDTTTQLFSRMSERAGQMSLSIYIAHALVFCLLVDWLDVVSPGSLGTSLLFALAYWLISTMAAVAYHKRFGRGPAVAGAEAGNFSFGSDRESENAPPADRCFPTFGLRIAPW